MGTAAEGAIDVAAHRRTPAGLARHVIDGLNVRSRERGNVHTVKTDDGTGSLAEVVVGKTRVRLNLRDQLPVEAPVDELHFGGFSTMWLGGGVEVTWDNANACRKLLQWLTARERASQFEEPGADGNGDADGWKEDILRLRDSLAESLGELDSLLSENTRRGARQRSNTVRAEAVG